jgi:hypothetical protein
VSFTLWLIFWTLIALIQSLQSYTGEIAEGGSPVFSRVLILQLFTWYPWALLAPLLFRHYRSLPLERLFSVRALLKKLDPSKFARIHRSTIVNLERVREVHPSVTSHVYLSTTVPTTPGVPS